MQDKIVVIAGDFHCGSGVGLTPPDWQMKPVKSCPLHTKRARVGAAIWREFKKGMKLLLKKPADLLILTGDLIDGTGERSGGTEQLTTDRLEQCKMAEEVIRNIPHNNLVAVYGTPYHTGCAEDYEEAIIRNMGGKIGSHEWVKVRGTDLVFDVKHFIAGSSIPHGVATPVLRDSVWSGLWSGRGEQPRSDIIVRGHQHTFVNCRTSDMEVTVAPALQGYGNKFGSRRCSKTVDWGFLLYRITTHDRYLTPYIVRIPEHKPEVYLA